MKCSEIIESCGHRFRLEKSRKIRRVSEARRSVSRDFVANLTQRICPRNTGFTRDSLHCPDDFRRSVQPYFEKTQWEICNALFLFRFAICNSLPLRINTGLPGTDKRPGLPSMNSRSMVRVPTCFEFLRKPLVALVPRFRNWSNFFLGGSATMQRTGPGAVTALLRESGSRRRPSCRGFRQ